MIIESDLKLDFKDVLIRPKRSTLQSRNDVDVNRTFTFLHTKRDWTGFPLIAANMDVTGSMGMARALSRFGAMTALHKHYKADELIAFFRAEDESAVLSNVFYSMGTTDADYDKFQAVKAKAPVGKICLDVANGYTERFVEVITRLRLENPDLVIMAGNVVTGDMTEALLLAGADIVKVGIGPGSVCTTRKMTGVGYPQLSAIIECADAAHGLKGQVCGDGGCAVPGDISKAYGAGADFVMLGGMLAGHDECEGDIRYEESDGGPVPVSMVFLRHVVGHGDAQIFRRSRLLPRGGGQDGGSALSRPGGGHDAGDHGRRAQHDDLYRRHPAEGGAETYHLRPRRRPVEHRVRRLTGGAPRRRPGGASVHLRQREDLAGIDQVGIADLLAVGGVDGGVEHAVAIGAARQPPQAVARLDDDAVPVGQAGGHGGKTWTGSSARATTLPAWLT